MVNNNMDKPIPTREAYGRTLEEMARNELYSDIVVLDADLSCSTKTEYFALQNPAKFFQMGISEQDMICTAVGLALSGKIPFVSTFAIFGSRAWEQIRNSIARMNLPVRLCFSHGGISVGEDGSSAQANEDVSIMRSIPNMKVFIPSDAIETKRIIYYLAEHRVGPAYVRLTRNAVPLLSHPCEHFIPGKGELLKFGNDGTFIACGQMVALALKTAEKLTESGYSVRVINMASIKPIDSELIIKACKETGFIITLEEHSIIGGLGSAVCEVSAEHHPAKVHRIGINDVFGVSGSPKELFEKYKFTENDIIHAYFALKENPASQTTQHASKASP